MSFGGKNERKVYVNQQNLVSENYWLLYSSYFSFFIYLYVAFCNAQVNIYVWCLRSINVKLLLLYRS